MVDLTEGSLAASLVWEGVAFVDRSSGINKIRTEYCRHLEARAVAVERLTRAAREALSFLRSIAADPHWTGLGGDPLLHELAAAVKDSEQWKEPTP